MEKLILPTDSDDQHIYLLDGKVPTTFATPEDLEAYLKQYPEAENDQACRLFRYTSRCSAPLMMTMFSNFDFGRFSMFPFGLAEATTSRKRTSVNSGSCSCENCRTGNPCGQQAMEISLSYVRPEWEAIEEDQSLRVSLYTDGFALHMENKALGFRTVSWNLQIFRFRSRRLEHIGFAYDALLWHSGASNTQLSSVPVNYVLHQLREILDDWNSTLLWATEYIGLFRFEILEERLEYDRKIIRNLLAAARVWETFRRLLRDQARELQFLENLEIVPKWTAESSDVLGLQTLANALMSELGAINERIERELIYDTNVLIQQITNLISIDEGYRSRDQNTSLTRLSWITFIFLPLLFASAIFGMNVDLFAENPSWVYYVYLSIPLFVAIIGSYLLLKYRKRIFRAVRDTLIGLFTVSSSDHLYDSELGVGKNIQNTEAIVRWAASAGRLDVVNSIMEKVQALPTSISWSDTPLLLAIRNGHKEIAEVLLDKTTNINAIDERGATALHWAAKHGMSSITERLLKNGADINLRDNEGQTAQDWAWKGADRTLRLGQQNQTSYGLEEINVPDNTPLPGLLLAAAEGDLQKIRELHEAETSLELRDHRGRTAIFHAIDGDQINALKLLLELQANIQTLDKNGWSALHLASHTSNLEAAQVLVERGANVSSISNSRSTPLHLIESVNCLPIMKLLIESGADINAVDTEGSTSAHIIARVAGNGSRELLSFLADHQALLTVKDRLGNTPAHISARYGNCQVLQFLKDKNIDICDAKNIDGFTPLIVAVENGQTAAVEFLLNSGISPNINLPSGKTLFEQAARWGRSGPLGVLSKYGASFNGVGSTGIAEEEQDLSNHPIWDAVHKTDSSTVLQLIDSGNFSINSMRPLSILQSTIESGQETLVQELLKRGARVDNRTWVGWTPLHSAVFSGKIGLAMKMLAMGQDPKTKDEQNWTALDLATFYCYEDIVDLLDPLREVRTFAWQKRKSDVVYRRARNAGITVVGGLFEAS